MKYQIADDFLVDLEDFEMIESLDDHCGTTDSIQRWTKDGMDYYLKREISENKIKSNLAANIVITNSPVEAPFSYKVEGANAIITESFGEKPVIPEESGDWIEIELNQDSLVSAYTSKALMGDRDLSKNIGVDLENGLFKAFDFDNAGNEIEESHVRAKRRLNRMVDTLEKTCGFEYVGSPIEDFYEVLGRTAYESNIREIEGGLEFFESDLQDNLTGNFRKARNAYCSDQSMKEYLNELDYQRSSIEADGVEIIQ